MCSVAAASSGPPMLCIGSLPRTGLSILYPTSLQWGLHCNSFGTSLRFCPWVLCYRTQQGLHTTYHMEVGAMEVCAFPSSILSLSMKVLHSPNFLPHHPLSLCVSNTAAVVCSTHHPASAQSGRTGPSCGGWIRDVHVLKVLKDPRKGCLSSFTLDSPAGSELHRGLLNSEASLPPGRLKSTGSSRLQLYFDRHRE